MTWPIVLLGDICEIFAGGGAPQLESDFCDDGIPFVRAGSLPKLLNGTQECQLEKINTMTANQYRLKLYSKDAIVFAKSGMSATKGHIYRLKNSCYIVNHLAILKPLGTCCPSYLEHALKKHSPVSLILDPAYPSIRLSDIANFKLPLPPLAEQRRIAAILDKVELVKRKRELAIEKLDELAQSVFIDMFGNPDINPKNFKEESLLEFFKFKTGKLDSNEARIDGIYPFFTCAKEDFFIDKYAFDEEALLLAGNNANADYSVKHFKGKFNAYQRTYVINLTDSSNSYIYAKDCLEFKLKELKHVSKGSSTKYLTMGIFKKMKLLVPPVKLQQEYSLKILNLRQSKEIMLSNLSVCNALNASIQAKFFQ